MKTRNEILQEMDGICAAYDAGVAATTDADEIKALGEKKLSDLAEAKARLDVAPRDSRVRRNEGDATVRVLLSTETQWAMQQGKLGAKAVT